MAEKDNRDQQIEHGESQETQLTLRDMAGFNENGKVQKKEALSFWRQKFEYLFAKYQEFFPEEFQTLWPILQGLDDDDFVNALIYGLEPRNLPLEILAELPNFDPQMIQDLITFKEKLIKALNAQIDDENLENEDRKQTHISPDQITSISDLIREHQMIEANDGNVIKFHARHTVFTHEKSELDHFKEQFKLFGFPQTIANTPIEELSVNRQQRITPELIESIHQTKELLWQAFEYFANLADRAEKDNIPHITGINTLRDFAYAFSWVYRSERDLYLYKDIKSYLVHTEQEADDLTQFIQRIEEYAYDFKINSVMSVLDVESRAQLPQELRIALEDLFFEAYGSTDDDQVAYIVAPTVHEDGWITGSYNDEQKFLNEFFGSKFEMTNERYINFLALISSAIKQNVQIRLSTLSAQQKERANIVGKIYVDIDGQKFLFRGAGIWNHYSQFDPFTRETPIQEDYDIAIFNVTNPENQFFEQTIPSTWQTLAEKYHFYEVNCDFAFGPSVLLPKILGHIEIENRGSEFEALKQHFEEISQSSSA